MAQIAGAGLNWIRLPIPFWAIETWEGEPFLAKVCWKCVFLVVYPIDRLFDRPAAPRAVAYSFD